MQEFLRNSVRLQNKRPLDNRRDILLLLLYSPGVGEKVNEPIVGRTRLMKMLFLFREEALSRFRHGTSINSENFYEFFPWNFGPFSGQVYDDLMFFTLHGFVQAGQTTEDTLPESAAEWELWLSRSRPDSEEMVITDYDEQAFSLTDRGTSFTADLYEIMSAGQRRLLKELKRRLSRVPLRALLKYVYENYPEQTANLLGAGCYF